MSAERWLSVAKAGEDFAASRGHVSMSITLTVPIRFHAKTLDANGRAVPNPHYTGETPADAQQWLQKQWAKVRAGLARREVPVYGLRMVEPHHDLTPHWHVLLWTRNADGRRCVRVLVRHHWLSEGIREPGEDRWRVLFESADAGRVSHEVRSCLCDSPMLDDWACTWGLRRAVPFGGLRELAAWGKAPCA